MSTGTLNHLTSAGRPPQPPTLTPSLFTLPMMMAGMSESELHERLKLNPLRSSQSTVIISHPGGPSNYGKYLSLGSVSCSARSGGGMFSSGLKLGAAERCPCVYCCGLDRPRMGVDCGSSIPEYRPSGLYTQ